ncbi:hypothetical protein [Cupriavidus sp. CP313]
MAENPLISTEALWSVATVLVLLGLWAILSDREAGGSRELRVRGKAGIAGLAWSVVLLWIGYTAAFYLVLDRGVPERSAATALIFTALAAHYIRRSLSLLRGNTEE